MLSRPFVKKTKIFFLQNSLPQSADAKPVCFAHANSCIGSLVQWLWEDTHDQKVQGLNPSAADQIDIFCCLKRTKNNRRRGREIPFKKPACTGACYVNTSNSIIQSSIKDVLTTSRLLPLQFGPRASQVRHLDVQLKLQFRSLVERP